MFIELQNGQKHPWSCEVAYDSDVTQPYRNCSAPSLARP